MCHNVHMKTISIRELHLKTGQWVRHAASRGPIVVTDRGRRVAALQPFDASVTSRPLLNREAANANGQKSPSILSCTSPNCAKIGDLLRRGVCGQVLPQ